MAKASKTLDWCIVRLGEDHNWWVDEVSDPVRWDVDGLSIVDPRQVSYLVDLVEPLRDYGFDQDVFEAAFVAFRIERDLGSSRVRLKRVKEPLFDAEEKLFALPDVVDEENGPFADLLDHLTRCRVKLLNDLFDFEAKLTVDEVEDEIREEQNASFMEGKATHSFDELCAILDYMPAGYESDEDEERSPKSIEEEQDDLPDIDEAEEEAMKNDSSLKWDEEEEGEAEEELDEFGRKKEGGKDGEAPALPEGLDDDLDLSADDDEEDEEEDEEEEGDEDDEEDRPKKKAPAKSTKTSKAIPKAVSKPAAKPATKAASKAPVKPASKTPSKPTKPSKAAPAKESSKSGGKR